VAISPAEVEWSSLELAAPVLEPYGADVVARIRAAPYVTRFPASLDSSPFPVTLRSQPEPGMPRRPLPDWWDRGGPLVYATFGTVAGTLTAGAAAYRAALDAVRGLPARVLLTIGHATDPAELGPVPSNVHVEAWVDQADVLASADALLCHGGSGTTFGALAAGVPLVFTPLFADQPVNARLVAGAGAGLIADAAGIRAALDTVLADPSYRSAARSIAAEMREHASVDSILDSDALHDAPTWPPSVRSSR
jgi:UDP:flavonoid glycosyltransferase YjiC (YdhE family)